jgi:hypothetical protein
VAEFLALVLPIFFMASSTIGVVWIQSLKSNLRIVSAEAAYLATQADTSTSDVESFVFREVEERLGLSLEMLKISQNEGLAAVELGIEPLELVGVGEIFSPVISVRTHGAKELH